MDYHSERFNDFSLIFFESDKCIALLPAHKKEQTVYSHLGLTYGGILLNDKTNKKSVAAIFDALFLFFKKNGITSLELKLMPDFYQKKNTKIIQDYLLKINAEKFRTDIVLAIDYDNPLEIHKTKLKHYRKNKNRGFEIKEEADLASFWETVLIPRLQSKHNVKPVHSLKEIALLKSRFPKQIRQFNIYLEDEILAGITIFDKESVVKSQYGATTDKGEKTRALEYLFLYLIYKFKDENRTYFSMGTVRDINKEMNYNEGLMRQKQELGCSVFSQNFFKIELK